MAVPPSRARERARRLGVAVDLYASTETGEAPPDLRAALARARSIFQEPEFEELDAAVDAARPDGGPKLAFALLLRARQHRSLGRLVEAWDDYDELLGIEADGPAPRLEGYRWSARFQQAGILDGLGRREEAAGSYRELLADADTPRRRFDALRRLAIAEARLGAHGEATRHLAAATAELESHEELHVLRPGLFQARALALRAAGREAEALPLFTESRRLADETDERAFLQAALVTEADSLTDTGRPEEGLRASERAEELARDAGSDLLWEALHAQGRALHRAGRPEEACERMLEALGLLWLQVRRTLSYELLHSPWGTSADGDAIYDEAVEACAEADAEAVERELRIYAQYRNMRLLAAILGADVPLEPGAPRAAPEAERSELALGVGTRRAARRDLTPEDLPGRGHEPEFDALLRDRVLPAHSVAPPRGVAELQARLPARSAVLELRLRPDDVRAYWIDAVRAERAVTAEPRAAIVERTAALRSAIVERRELEAVRDVGGPLFEALLGPFAARLSEVDQLILVPDGDVQDLPWGALPLGGSWLDESVTLTSVPSREVLLVLLSRPPRELRDFLGIADAQGDLGAARDEVLAAAPRFERPRPPLLGERATRRGLFAALPGTDVLHVAVHAVSLSPKHPAWLQLADGRLSATEVGLLALDPSLVVLSGCRTQRGGAAQGETLVHSLVRAFLAAGADAVVGTLWDVDDEASAELADGFYRRLSESEAGPARALQGARQELRRSTERRHPYYWAGHVLVGRP